MTSPTAWQVATVTEAEALTPDARRIVLDVPTWPGNVAGQHIDLRLTAENGYQATRSYSLASAGPAQQIELAVDRVHDGEVSPFLVDDLSVGDQLELEGPLGGWFIWKPDSDPRPVQLIAGGSGVVPFIGMLRAHAAAGETAPMRLLYALRTPDDVFFRDELDRIASDDADATVDFAFSRRTPDDWPDPPGRVSLKLLADHTVTAESRPRLFVCGSTGFVEAVLTWLIELGHASKDIHAERFGGAS